MKYSPKLYARAFGELAAGALSDNKETILARNFLAAVRKNGDVHQLKKIYGETEKFLRLKDGRRKITIETAREIAGLKIKLKHFFAQLDIVEEKINPELLAGVKITVNDETEFDGTLKRKIDKLFG